MGEYLAPELVDHNPSIPGQAGDRESMRSAGAVFRTAFPDWRSTVEDLIAVNDKVVERFTARGTHQAELMHIPRTGRAVALKVINIFRLRNGKIVERWGVLDQLGLMQHLGAAPDASAPPSKPAPPNSALRPADPEGWTYKVLYLEPELVGQRD